MKDTSSIAVIILLAALIALTLLGPDHRPAPPACTRALTE